MTSKKTILAFFIGLSLNANGSTINNESVRLVITEKNQYSETLLSHGSTTGSQASSSLSVRVKEVPVNEQDAAIEFLERDPEVISVELDSLTHNPYFIPEDQSIAQGALNYDGTGPNDPEFSKQEYWNEPTATYSGNMAILEGVKRSKKNKKLRIGITDSGFVLDNDIEWGEGYSFTTINGETPGADFLEDSYRPECTSPHGSAVAHIIGAKTDNYLGMAGAVDASIHPVRVMSCGSGYLSDLARGVRWLAKDSSLGVTPEITKPVDIINISMGSTNVCPSYLQSAIDYAYKKGIPVIVSAGNSSVDVDGYSPAGCNNVLTVAAIDSYGEQTAFTNFGKGVDVSGLGILVRSFGGSYYRYWSGTSFSSPLATAAAAQALQTNPSLSPRQLFNYLKVNTEPYKTNATSNPLGSGIVSAKALMNAVNKDLGRDKPTLNTALSEVDRSNKAAYEFASYIDENDNLIRPCNIFEVNSENFDFPENGTYQNRVLFAVGQGGDLQVNSENIITGSDQDKFIEHNLDPELFDYGFALCNADGTDCLAESIRSLGDDNISPRMWCKP